MYYVRLREILRTLLSVPGILKHLRFQSNHGTEEIRDLLDGQFYKTHPLFSENSKKTLILELWIDDMETVNPLGSKTTLHKISTWLYTVQNLPSYFNSSMQNIHLLALCHAQDIKIFGVKPILEKLVDDVKELETTGAV